MKGRDQTNPMWVRKRMLRCALYTETMKLEVLQPTFMWVLGVTSHRWVDGVDLHNDEDYDNNTDATESVGDVGLTQELNFY